MSRTPILTALILTFTLATGGCDMTRPIDEPRVPESMAERLEREDREAREESAQALRCRNIPSGSDAYDRYCRGDR